jgi:hypothetical protein
MSRGIGCSVRMLPNTALEPTPVTPGSFRFGFPVGGCHRRRGSAFGSLGL